MLALRGSLTPGDAAAYAETLGGGLHREDARPRAIEMLFERLAVALDDRGLRDHAARRSCWRATGWPRRPSASSCCASLRAHLAENFPELEAP